MTGRIKKITVNKPLKIHGKYRSVKVKSKQATYVFDEKKLGAGPARAIREYISSEIKEIHQRASSGTISRRQSRNISSQRLFNVTGKLATSLGLVSENEKHRITLPDDRLIGDTAFLFDRLMKLIDISPRDLLRDRDIQKSIRDSLRLLIL